jgi:nucleotide-binding universal stress UspA family protein
MLLAWLPSPNEFSQSGRLKHQDPYRAIIDTADSKGCDLIVMASHGRRGISAIVLGSETVKVLTHCKIPVLVYR